MQSTLYNLSVPQEIIDLYHDYDQNPTGVKLGRLMDLVKSQPDPVIYSYKQYVLNHIYQKNNKGGILNV